MCVIHARLTDSTFKVTKMVKEAVLDKSYLISKNIDETDFWDNFQLTSEELDAAPKPKDMMIAFFLSFPKSFTILLHLREFIVKPLGLKTAPKTDKRSRYDRLYQFNGEVGESIAIFEVLEKDERELLTGQNDSHLDFKLSFISYQANDNIKLELVTTVIFNNTLGKIYFHLIKPFHRFYIKRILKRMEKQLLHKSW